MCVMTDKDEEQTTAQEPVEGAAGSKAGDPLALPPAGRGMQRFAMLIFLLVGAGLTAFVLLNPFSIPFLPQPGGRAGDVEDGRAGPTGRKILYQCPMHPEVIEPDPGNCPICRIKP